jgi:two-component system sensor histidine kinase KdpD
MPQPSTDRRSGSNWAADMTSAFTADTEPRSLPRALRALAETLLMVAGATGLGLLMAPRWGNAAVDLLYLVPVLVAASVHGLRPALFAAVVSALAYNFFFTAPVHTFLIHSPADIVTVAMLFAVALVVSKLASAMRTQARIAAAEAARNATIAGFAGRLLSCPDRAAIGLVTCEELATLFHCNAALLATGTDTRPEIVARRPHDVRLTPGDTAAAAWVLQYGEIAGRGSPRLAPAEWLFFPVRSGERTIATLGLARDDGRRPVPDEHLPLLSSLLDQSALALDRAALEQEMQGVASLRERDRLRGALLSSVGHDLRTPLTAIKAAAAALRRQAQGHDADMVATIESEAATLDRYIANLLDMARIEAGAIRLNREPIDLVDAVSAATRDLKRALSGRPLAIDLPPDLPLVRTDPQLFHHILINIIDNAARHSSPGGPITVMACRDGDGLLLSIEDEGPGMEGTGAGLDSFTRIAGSDRSGGTGLGLAIVRSFADAMELNVAAADRSDGKGTRFSLRFPAAQLVREQGEVDGPPA